jgi:hypothetical protein
VENPTSSDELVASSSSVDDDAPTPPSFGNEIDTFVKHMDAIGAAGFAVVIATQHVSNTLEAELKKFEDEQCEIEELADGARSVTVPVKVLKDWRKISRRAEQFLLARTLMPRSQLVTLVSQYDAYLGRLMRVIFVRMPFVLNTSERQITFEKLQQFETIAAARESLLEKEVESILRTSHQDQFKWMSDKFKIPLTKGLACWPQFIEIMERRNLFVHTDGVVSSQYIAACKKVGCSIKDTTKEGTRLGVSQKYFERSVDTIYEVGLKLGHVLWRKLFPAEREVADKNLLNRTYELLITGRYALAIKLLDFVVTLKKFTNESYELMFIVNRAQAYKWDGNQSKCVEIMRSIDWSAKGEQFKLADAVLADDWDSAVRIMKQIGKNGSVDEAAYRDWPLFKDFRKENKFLETFREVFGEEFSVKAEVKPDTTATRPDTVDAAKEVGASQSERPSPNVCVPPEDAGGDDGSTAMGSS